MASSDERMPMSIAIAFVVATVLTTCCLWAVTKWTGVVVPIVDLLIIAGLCSGLAMLPSLGWVLATLIMSLLILRTTDAETWPDAVLMLVGSSVIWLSVKLIFTG